MLKDLTINQRIRYFRKRAYLNQTTVAQGLGIKCSSYSQMERQGHITCETLIKLSKILDVNILILLYGMDAEQLQLPEDKQADYEELRKELEKKYLKRYGFLEDVSYKELKLLQTICCLKKSDRYEIYDIAFEKFRNRRKKSTKT